MTIMDGGIPLKIKKNSLMTKKSGEKHQEKQLFKITLLLKHLLKKTQLGNYKKL